MSGKIYNFTKKEFIRSVKENLRSMYRKNLDAATQEELFQVVSATVKDVIMDQWISTQETMDKEDPKIVYYMSMEFLMGRVFCKSPCILPWLCCV